MAEAARPILNRAVTSNIADLSRRFAGAKPLSCRTYVTGVTFE